jgi:hypothetical protein
MPSPSKLRIFSSVTVELPLSMTRPDDAPAREPSMQISGLSPRTKPGWLRPSMVTGFLISGNCFGG